MTHVELQKQLKKLPANPGIYLFKGPKNKPLYIGKALNLKNRLKSYSGTDNPRLEKMIMESTKIDVIETKNEIEALLLESQYIKKYRPDFNIMLRDDKQYGFVGFTNEEYPKIFVTHQPTKIQNYPLRSSFSKTSNSKLKSFESNFIGPFTDAGALKITLRLLRRISPYCTCKQLHNNYCLNYHIGKCFGFCCLKQQNPNLKFKNQNVKLYQKNIKTIKDILSGKKSSLIRDLEKEMKVLGENKKYEKVIELQYKIEKLMRVFQNATIIENLKLSALKGRGLAFGGKIKNSDADKATSKTLQKLQQLLGMKETLHRIEAYDIANIQGKHAVGAMVVFENGKPDKNQYRKFKIQNGTTSQVVPFGGGDTGMLREVLTRRFNHPEWPYPDLILIDGGRAQFNTAKNIAKNIPIIALTKNEKHLGEKIYIMDKHESIPLSKLPITIKNLLLYVDSEAHRFAITYYRKLHGKSFQ